MTVSKPTLLCLLSDQRMQNVLPLFQRGMNFQRMILIGSAVNGGINKRYARIGQDIINTLSGRVECLVWHQPVDPIDPRSSFAVCQQIVNHYGGPAWVTINFTGGLKPMSIGAYQAGSETGCAMIYIDTQTEQFHLFRQGNIQAIDFNLDEISVGTVLHIHGHPVDEKASASLANPLYESLINTVQGEWSRVIPQLIHLQAKIKYAKITSNGEIALRAYNEKNIAWFFAAIEQHNLLRRAGTWLYIHPSAASLIRGGWLEACAFDILKNSAGFMDVAVNVKVAGVENELDLACTLNGKLGIIECKSGQIKGPDGQSYLNRLRTLKESLGGTFGRSFLVTAARRNSLSADIERRAKEYVARLVYVEELPQLDQIIASELSSKSRS